MSRHAKTKAELLESIRSCRQQLENKYAKLTPEQMVWPGSMGNWSVKDILAHLVDWEQRFISWYQTGLRGEVPETPAPGLHWGELPKLNQIGYENHRHETLDEVMTQFVASHNKILELVGGMSEEEIFTPGYYPWTGTKPLLNWINANTASHYNWAKRNIRTTMIHKHS
jgi:hypothetical protein